MIIGYIIWPVLFIEAEIQLSYMIWQVFSIEAEIRLSYMSDQYSLERLKDGYPT